MSGKESNGDISKGNKRESNKMKWVEMESEGKVMKEKETEGTRIVNK